MAKCKALMGLAVKGLQMSSITCVILDRVLAMMCQSICNIVVL